MERREKFIRNKIKRLKVNEIRDEKIVSETYSGST